MKDTLSEKRAKKKVLCVNKAPFADIRVKPEYDS